MIRVITLPNPRLAQAFVDYMATLGVRLQAQTQAQNVSLWLHDECHLRQVETELQRFLSEPTHPRYQAASWQTGDTKSHLPLARSMALHNLAHQTGKVTKSVVLICLLVYLSEILFGSIVMDYLAWPEKQKQYWQIWRYFTHALLHFSPLHILFNLVLWWYLGGQVERRITAGKLVQITLVAALISGWAQSLFSGANFGGLSGVVYALLGYVWWYGLRAPRAGIGAPSGLMMMSVIWLLIGHFGWFGLSLANAAHLGGLVIGLFIAFWDLRQAHR